MRFARGWSSLKQDLAFSLRGMLRAPGPVLAMMLTLGLGLGATAVMFDVVDRLLLSPPAQVGSPSEVVRLGFASSYGPQDVTEYPTFTDLRDGVSSFEEIASFGSIEMPLGRGDGGRNANVSLVTGSFFQLLRVRPVIGRLFAAADDRLPTGSPVVVLSYSLWRTKFGADTDVIGRDVIVAGRPFTIVGVAPDGFAGVELHRIDLWVPMSAAADKLSGPKWYLGGGVWFAVVARMRSGTSFAAAEAQATAVARQGARGRPYADSALRVFLLPITGSRNANGSPSARAQVAGWLFGVSCAVLLIAVANVGNLVLARTWRRRRELAIRVALGGTRARLTQLLLTESFFVTALGWAAGLAFAIAGTALVRRGLLSDIAWGGSTFGGRAFTFAAVAAVATSVLIASVPLAQLALPEFTSALSAATREGTRRSERLRSGLVLLQATLVAALLVGAGLFVRSLQHARAHDLGFDADRVLIATIWSDSPNKTHVDQVLRESAEQLRGSPDVERASISLAAPFYFAFGASVGLTRAEANSPASHIAFYNLVSEDYFRTMGMPILQGRSFERADYVDGVQTAVMNQSMARSLWPNDVAVGRCFFFGSDSVCTRVIGIVADASQGSLRTHGTSQLYLPLGDRPGDMGATTMLVKTTGDPAALIPSLRQTLLRVDPRLLLADVRPLRDLIEPELRPWRLSATVFALLAPLALLVAGVGLYAIIAYGVTRRSSELGVRAALGATPARLVWLVVREATVLTIAGLVIGFAAALAAASRVEPLLFDVSATDPRIYGMVAVTLLLVATAAAARPAWRVARTDPSAALRAE